MWLSDAVGDFAERNTDDSPETETPVDFVGLRAWDHASPCRARHAG